MDTIVFQTLIIHRTAVGSALLTALGFTLFWSYRARSRINELRKLGYVCLSNSHASILCANINQPMHQWSWLWGHLRILQRYISRYPADTFFTIVMEGLAREFSDTDMFYLDLWPVAPPFLCISDPDVANQVTAKHTFPKAEYFNTLFEPLMGGPSLLTMNAKDWKEWRALLNPGFSPAYLLNQLPATIDYVQIFCDKLRDHAETGDVFPLENIATRMTMDVIIKVTL